MVKARRSNKRVNSAAALSYFYFHPSVVKQHVNMDLTHGEEYGARVPQIDGAKELPVDLPQHVKHS